MGFEHINVYPSLLQAPDATVDYFKLDRIREIGAVGISREIAEHVAKTKPDVLMFFVPYALDKEVFRKITRDTSTITVGFFSDDDSDLYQHSLAWTGVFDWMVTFYPPAFEEYQKRGVNVIGINWAANPDFWTSLETAPTVSKKDIGVSFIGAAKDERKTFVKKLADRGVAVACYGAGWPNGPVSFEQMRELIGRSKINLNIGLGKPIWRLKTLARIFITPKDGNVGYRFDALHAGTNLKTILNRRRPMGRGRPFELAAAGAFVLTNRNAPLFGEPFVEGKEMVTYTDIGDAAEKIGYYLAHDAEREAIARAGHERTIQSQSFKKRVTDILTFVQQHPKPKGPMTKVLA
jgi:spore maturation protein CgeB